MIETAGGPVALFDAYPQTRERLAHTPLGQWPTPVERLSAMGVASGIPALYIKRDDLSGSLYGGNKVRKLEFIFGDALARGYERVVTIGAIGSHHILATSIYARELGMAPVALQFQQPLNDHVRHNLLALSTTQPELHLLAHMVGLPFAIFIQKVRDWRDDHPEAYYIPGGGSSPLGALGYVSAGLELAAQVRAGECPEPDVIFVTTGTGGTYVGLLLGCRLGGLRSKIVAVRVVDRLVSNTANILQLAHRTAHILSEAGVPDVPRLTPSDVTILDDYFGEDYGVATVGGLRAIDEMKRVEDLKLEPTYTGKTFAGLLAERARMGLSDKNVLYWHTLSSVDLSPRVAAAQPERDLPADYLPFLATEAAT